MFFDVDKTEARNFERTRFLNMDLGQHLFRVLGTPLKLYSHFIRGKSLTIKCLDEDCPICQANARIKTERPTDYFTNSAYFGRSERHYVNVLDRTPVKICPSCQTENKQDLSRKFPPTCTECDTFLTNVQATVSDKVKVLNLSKTLADSINGYSQSVCDAEGNPLGVHNFDLMLMVTKTGDKKNPVVYPVPENNDKVEVPEENYYDLEKAIITLTAEEITNVLRGVSIKDIYVARRSTPEAALEGAVQASNEEVKEKINKLFA